MLPGQEDAKRFVDSFFQDRISNGGAGRDEFYSEIFWKNTDKKRWATVKQLVDCALGNLKSYTFVSSNVTTISERTSPPA